MRTYVVRRLFQTVPILLGITLLSFAFLHLSGDPIRVLYGATPDLTPEDLDRLRRQAGLDQPLLIQYVLWLSRAANLDFGASLVTYEPVAHRIAERLANTLQLTASALFISVALGTSLGLLAALKRHSLLDGLIKMGTAVSDAIPDFWLGLLTILVFAVWLRLLPSGGVQTLGIDSFDPIDRLKHLLLPTLVLATSGVAGFARYVRAETLEILNQDYVRTARAKGLSQRTVVTRHVLKNALLPVITILGGSLASLFTGAIVIENVFSWPGIGRLGVEAVFQRDYPVVMGLLTIGSFLLIIGYLLADLAYAWADPRIHYE